MDNYGDVGYNYVNWDSCGNSPYPDDYDNACYVIPDGYVDYSYWGAIVTSSCGNITSPNVGVDYYAYCVDPDGDIYNGVH